MSQHVKYALLRSLFPLRDVPPAVKLVVVGVVPGALLLMALSSLGWFVERVTPAPELPPAPSPWLVARGAAEDDGACQLSLRVTHEGNPVDGARVEVVRLGDGGVVAQTYEARTDRKGAHRLLDLPPGSYDVTVDVDGKALQGTPTFRCEGPGQRAFFDVDVRDGDRVIAGRLLGQGRAPLRAASVALYQDDANRTSLAGVVRVRTDDDGRFVAPVPVGRYVLYASAREHVARKITVDVDAPTTNVALRLAYSPEVRGIVVDEEGNPLADALVTMGGAYDPRAKTASVRTDETGHFALPVQEGQELSLTARAAGRVARAVVGIVDDARRFQDLRLVAMAGRTVTGVVLRADGTPHAFGGVHFRVRSLGIEGVAPTDRDGRFALEGMPNDDVEVWAEGNATGAWGARVADASMSHIALTWMPPAW